MKREILHITKIGGKVIEDRALLGIVLDGFVQLKGLKILVHGGGKRANELSRRLGFEPRIHEGRRITDDNALEVAVMVYAGWSNKTIVSQLQMRGCDGLGLSGADGNVIRAHKRPVGDIDYGFAGDIDEVNTALIRHLLLARVTPVFCAVTHNGNGQLLNTNADTIAARLARALAPYYDVHLRYCFEKPGVLLDPGDDASLIRSLSFDDYQRYRLNGVITDGMLPKLDNAFGALRDGAAQVTICGPVTVNALGTVLQLKGWSLL